MLVQLEEAIKRIKSTRPYMIAAKQELLEKLPPGNWIGGTVPFLMGSCDPEDQENIVDITPIPSEVSAVKIKTYDLDNIHLIRHDGFSRGISFLIIPGESPIHHSFAMNSRDFPDGDKNDLIGWISGYSLDEGGTARIVYGPKKRFLEDKAVVLHCKLKEGYEPQIQEINVFKEGQGPIIEFPESGFSAGPVMIDGERRPLSEYLQEENLNIESPLISIGEEGGETVSFKNIDGDRVRFYAPVFKYHSYRHAERTLNYSEYFQELLRTMVDDPAPVFSCNCILNYSYCEELSKATGKSIEGPVTFGEIHNHLLNQTCLSLRIVAN